ncbi:MAG: sigma-70 family RNA polymerase sigma factor [Gemmataceae bacterium]
MLFRNAQIQQLVDQLTRFTPMGRRAQQKERAEVFLGEVHPEKQYPYQLVCYRITGYRPEKFTDLLIPGQDLQHDLRLLIHSLASAQPVTEEVFTVEEVSRLWNVSTKTVRRWRNLGLIGLKIVRNGKRKLGFTRSEIERFVNLNKARVEKSGNFSQLSKAEKVRILEMAKRMARLTKAPMTEISVRIAKRVKRSPETVRYTIRNHDIKNPEQAIFPDLTGPLTPESRETIYHSYQRGETVDTIAKRFQRNRTSMYRAIHEVRARRILELPLDFIPNPCFEDKSMERAILAPMPNLDDYENRKSHSKAPKDIPSELAYLYEVPLLNKEQEQHLFRKFNFLKYKASSLRKRLCKTDEESGILDPTKIQVSLLEDIENVIHEASLVKNLLINANMRLVVNIAKRHSGQVENFFDLISDGNMSLIRAVEKFDYGRGFKFSTYATWAIMKNFARTIPNEINHRERYVTGQEDVFNATMDNRTDESELMAQKERACLSINRLLNYLEPREREIIRLRAGLDSAQKSATLEEIGAQFGITKERVRQIHARSMRKLRHLVEDNHLEMP